MGVWEGLEEANQPHPGNWSGDMIMKLQGTEHK